MQSNQLVPFKAGTSVVGFVYHVFAVPTRETMDVWLCRGRCLQEGNTAKALLIDVATLSKRDNSITVCS